MAHAGERGSASGLVGGGEEDRRPAPAAPQREAGCGLEREAIAAGADRAENGLR